MCSGSDYDAWERGEIYFVKYHMTSISAYADKEFVTFDEALDIIAKSSYYSNADIVKEEFRADLSKEDLDSELAEYDFLSYDTYWGWAENYEETFEDRYTTKNGETVVAFGYYGYDG
jgi:hypothetical protein